jgi:phosphoserine phosphatase RsbU/P
MADVVAPGELRIPGVFPVPAGAAPVEEPARILVVDDNEMNRDMLSRRLRRRGFAAEVAVDGRDALACLAREPFDLVLLDIMMPEMDGYEVLERLKASEELRHVPVIMISALDDMDSVVRCIELGAEDHLPKPFNPTLLGARIGASLEKKRLRDRERLWARSLEREMEIGREIQAGFLPGELPAPAGWDIAAAFAPARQVAGDFYDAFELSGGRVGVVMADVCGKGVGAALFMALFRSLLRVLLAQRWDAAQGEAPVALRETCVLVNDYIARTHGDANMFATAVVGILEPGGGLLDYVNAGHDAPVVVAAAGGAGDRLEPTGPALGLLPGAVYRTGAVSLQPGETLLLFTDGVSDARGPGGALGEERLLGLLDVPASGGRDLLARIEEEVARHCAGLDPFDDLTLLALRRLPRSTSVLP